MGDQAGLDLEGHLPGSEPRHAQDGQAHQQAPVLRPWASPGHPAEEFRRRAGLPSRGLKSCARVGLLIPLPDLELNFCRRTRMFIGAGARPGWKRRAVTARVKNVTTLQDFPKFSKMSGAAPS